MSHSRRYLTVAAALLLGVAAFVPQASAAPRAGDFTAALGQLNVGGTGTATITQRGTNLTVHLQATGLDDGTHLAHIHGVTSVDNVCPDQSFDADGDGLVNIAEGLPAYGPVQVTLSTGEMGASVDVTRVFTRLDSGGPIAPLGSLDRYVVVVHGVDLDGDGVASNPDVDGDGPGDPDDNEITMPALCGVVEFGG